MGQVKIDTLNVNTLVIQGKNYVVSNEDTIYSTNFIADERYVITSDMIVDGQYNISKSLDEDSINMYNGVVKTTVETLPVIKVTNRTFRMGTDELSDSSYIYINGTIKKIISRYDSGTHVTFTIESDYVENFTEVTPIRSITINGELYDNAKFSTIKDGIITTYYDYINTDNRDMDIVCHPSVQEIVLDVNTSLREELLPTIDFNDVYGDDSIEISGALLTADDIIELNGGQSLSLESSSKLEVE